MMRSEITIPTEVLSDIFHLLCDAPIALHDLKNDSHFHEFPWAVGQVSRRWRGAFLYDTRLWTSFALEPGTFSADYFVEMNRRVTIYLERSGQQPLTIDVAMPCSSPKTFPKTIWEMLLSCLKRWKKADLILVYGGALDQLLRCKEYMSSLESLTMCIPDLRAVENYNIFQVAPHLTELGLAHPGYTSKWQFPWAQLTKLNLEVFCEEFNDHYSNNLWGVLFQLKNIEELHIMATFGGARAPSPLPVACLPCLRLLEISLVSAMIFSWFTAPLLEHLHIHGCANLAYDHDDQPYERELTSLIQRSSCHIRRLVLENCGTKEMRIMMKALAGVKELSITNYPGPPIIIQDITGLDNCIYLPKLQVLEVTKSSRMKNTLVAVSLLENAVTVFSRLFEARGKGLSMAGHDIVPLEKFVLRLALRGKCPDKVLEMMHRWPSFAQVYINGFVLERFTRSL